MMDRYRFFLIRKAHEQPPSMLLQDIIEVEQRYNRSLVEEDYLQWKPEKVSSAENMLINVQVSNEAWVPRRPIPHEQEWDEQSMTLMQVWPKFITGHNEVGPR